MRKFLKHSLFKKRVLILLLIQVILTLLFISCGSVPVITNAKVLPSGKTDTNFDFSISIQLNTKGTDILLPPWIINSGFSFRLGLFDWIELGGAIYPFFMPAIGADIKFALLKLEKNYFALDLYAKAMFISYFHFGGSLLYTYDFNDTSSLNCLVGAIRTVVEMDHTGFKVNPDVGDFILGGIYYSWLIPLDERTIGLGVILTKEVTCYQSWYITPIVTFKF